jgi:nucleotide-binding universal stress UspA family protein
VRLFWRIFRAAAWLFTGSAMDIRTILAPVDFSTCSLLATRQAASLASRLGARLILLHVSEIPAGMKPRTRLVLGGTEQSASGYVTHDVETRLEPFLAVARELKVPAEALPRVGPVVKTILETAEDTRADLIFMGTHGRSGLARVMLGSVAESVLHEARVPVMLVRRETRPECARESCDWCPHTGTSEAEDRLADEAQG